MSMHELEPPRRISNPGSISAAQCRAARGMANWSIGRLSREAEVTVAEIVALERGRALTRAATLRSLIRAFGRGGIRFTSDEGLRLIRESPEEAGQLKQPDRS
jgi:transcriptional regulator with XRE-family HTH domain